MGALDLAEVNRMIEAAGSCAHINDIADDEEVFVFQAHLGTADYHEAMGETGSMLMALHVDTARELGMKGDFADGLPVVVAKRKKLLRRFADKIGAVFVTPPWETDPPPPPRR